jgi:hypothetical protein
VWVPLPSKQPATLLAATLLCLLLLLVGGVAMVVAVPQVSLPPMLPLLLLLLRPAHFHAVWVPQIQPQLSHCLVCCL